MSYILRACPAERWNRDQAWSTPVVGDVETLPDAFDEIQNPLFGVSDGMVVLVHPKGTNHLNSRDLLYVGVFYEGAFVNLSRHEDVPPAYRWPHNWGPWPLALLDVANGNTMFNALSKFLSAEESIDLLVECMSLAKISITNRHIILRVSPPINPIDAAINTLPVNSHVAVSHQLNDYIRERVPFHTYYQKLIP